MILNARGRPVTSEPLQQRNVKDLLLDCQDAASKMGRTNSPRALLWECYQALVDLSQRLYQAEQAQAKASPVFVTDTQEGAICPPLQ